MFMLFIIFYYVVHLNSFFYLNVFLVQCGRFTS